MRHFSSLLAAGVSLSALVAPFQAYAAEADVAATTAAKPAVVDDTGVSMNSADIIVTARRRDENVQDVPAVVNALSQDTLKKLQIRNFEDIQKIVPGLQMATNANGIGTTSSIRGVNYDVNASGNSGTIAYYLNDSPTSPGSLFQNMYDIQSIEVLRGPQGTLKGVSSPSGSISVQTVKPDLDDIGGAINFTATTNSLFNANFAINVPIISDKLAVRVAGMYEENEANQVTSINSTAKPFADSQGVRFSLLFQPFDNFEVGGSFSTFVRKAQTFDQVELQSLVDPTAPPSPILITPSDRLGIGENPRTLNQTFNQYNWNASWGFAGQRLVYVGSYLSQDIKSYAPADAAEFFKGYEFGQPTHSTPHQWANEIRLQNEERVFNDFDYVVGFYKSSLDAPTTLTSQTAVALFGRPVTTVNTAVERGGTGSEYSFFGNLTWHLGDKTQFSGGLRQIHTEATGFLNVNGVPNTAADQDDSFNKLIYLFSAQYNFNEDFMVYANTGTSFRPGISVVGDFSLAQSALERSFLVLPPETSTNYELGVKSTWFDRQVVANLTGYHQTYQNYPYRNPSGVYYISTDPATGGGTVQSVKSFNFVSPVPVEVNGVELELSYQPSSHFNISTGLSYSLGKIQDGTVACNDLNGDGIPDAPGPPPTLAQLQAAVGANNLASCQTSQRSSFAPPFSGYVQSEYSIPLLNNIGYVSGLLSWFGSSQNDPTNPWDDVPTYALLNLYVGMRSDNGDWEVSLYGKNITNNETVLTTGNAPLTTNYQALQPPTFRTAAGASATAPYVGITTTTPQEFGLNLRFRFNAGN